jgi:prefoldin subunit 5
MDDIASYQSSETAWRYDSRVGRLKEKIEQTQNLLQTLEEELKQLEARPPLYHLFNWSA